MAGGEDGLTAWLANLAGSGNQIGDDAALLEIDGRKFALTVDTQRANVHIPIDLDPAAAARRLLAVSLSDLAATGAEPRWALLALGIDDDTRARRFLAALVRRSRRYGIELIGGDTARPGAPGHLDASLTVIGEVPADCSPLTRGAARPGDDLWLGGPVGESALGLELVRRGARIVGRETRLPDDLPPELVRAASRVVRRHLEPRPQLELGLLLAKRRPRVSAIDISDGLAVDAGRLCRSSGTGCILHRQKLSLRPDARRLAHHLDLDPVDLVLGGGEDYVLLFTLPPVAKFEHPGCRPIGRVTSTAGMSLQRGGGALEPVAPEGWDHLA
jgi:thiamine-monophosphate kinase